MSVELTVEEFQNILDNSKFLLLWGSCGVITFLPMLAAVIYDIKQSRRIPLFDWIYVVVVFIPAIIFGPIGLVIVILLSSLSNHVSSPRCGED